MLLTEHQRKAIAHDGDVFVDGRMFFDFQRAPSRKAAFDAEVDPEQFSLRLTSEAFPLRRYRLIAVKVVDFCGNESTVVRALSGGR